MPAYIRLCLRRLTTRIIDIERGSISSETHSDSTCGQKLTQFVHIMADGEEDYSSLPLTDRWVHKVRML